LKKFFSFFILFAGIQYAIAQPSNDTTKLIPQKENIITSKTILKIENLGQVSNGIYYFKRNIER